MVLPPFLLLFFPPPSRGDFIFETVPFFLLSHSSTIIAPSTAYRNRSLPKVRQLEPFLPRSRDGVDSHREGRREGGFFLYVLLMMPLPLLLFGKEERTVLNMIPRSRGEDITSPSSAPTESGGIRQTRKTASAKAANLFR